MRADLAAAAAGRARMLLIPCGLYLRILLRNAVKTGHVPPAAPERARFVRVPVSLVCAAGERETFTRAALPLDLPEFLERLVAEDTAEPKRPLLIYPT